MGADQFYDNLKRLILGVINYKFSEESDALERHPDVKPKPKYKAISKNWSALISGRRIVFLMTRLV